MPHHCAAPPTPHFTPTLYAGAQPAYLLCCVLVLVYPCFTANEDVHAPLTLFSKQRQQALSQEQTPVLTCREICAALFATISPATQQSSIIARSAFNPCPAHAAD